MLTEELVRIIADKVLDVRGTACPGPLLEARKGIGAVELGQVIEIKSNDKGFLKDIAAWSGKMGHEFMGLIEADEYDGPLSAGRNN